MFQPLTLNALHTLPPQVFRTAKAVLDNPSKWLRSTHYSETAQLPSGLPTFPGDPDACRFTFAGAVTHAMASLIAPPSHPALFKVFIKIIAIRVSEACRDNVEIWANAPGRTLTDLHELLTECAENARRSTVRPAEGYQVAACTLSHLLRTFADGSAWIPGKKPRAVVHGKKTRAVYDADASAWTASGALCKALFDAEREFLDPIHAAWGEFAVRALLHTMTGSPSLKTLDGDPPRSFTQVKDVLSRALDYLKRTHHVS